jgi:methionyl-tRNA synthetase
MAGVYIPADIYVRYLRLKGQDVIFIGGSDEHGVPITIRAKKEGVTPQDIVDKYHSIIKKSFEDFGITFDIYSRTSSEIHKKTASDYFLKLYSKGEFEEKTSEQYYDEESRMFLADRYIMGECPHCGNPNAYGDQCESCGTSLSPTDLKNPRSTISGAAPVMRETKHWYLPLDKHESWLRQWILNDHKEWKSNVYGQCKSWLDMGLQPRAVSRDLDWGVPIPLPDAKGKVLYVWFDAPIGYISNTIELLPDSWEKWWKSEDTKLVHFIGKDNIVFHCIVFPAMLKAEGSFILPENVPANEFLNLEGEKISTSRNWAVWLHEYLEDFPGQQDILRYVLTANAPETKDNDFTWKDFQARNNNELVAILGNFINRALVLTQKYFDNKVPRIHDLTDYDKETLKEFADVKDAIESYLETYRFRDALKEAMNLARIGNKYLADTEPWKVAKTDMARVETILNISLQITANLSIAFEPFLPFSVKKIRRFINMENLTWSQLGQIDLLPEGHALNQSELLFSKIEDETIDKQVQKLLDTKKANEQAAEIKVAPQKPNVAFDDFTKLDLRVGAVLECVKVPKADKLLQFLIDDGMGKRTIISGIAAWYKPEDLVGKQVCFIANLEPRKLKGVESQGMILSVEDADGNLSLIQPSVKVNPGSQIG